MKLRHNQAGSHIVAVVLLVAVVGVIGLVGWRVLGSTKATDGSKASTSEKTESQIPLAAEAVQTKEDLQKAKAKLDAITEGTAAIKSDLDKIDQE